MSRGRLGLYRATVLARFIHEECSDHRIFSTPERKLPKQDRNIRNYVRRWLSDLVDTVLLDTADRVLARLDKTTRDFEDWAAQNEIEPTVR